jgi:hypothetical protein
MATRGKNESWKTKTTWRRTTEQERTELGWNTWRLRGQWQKTEAGGSSVSGPYMPVGTKRIGEVGR